MKMMSGTTLRDIDGTDIDTLLPWYFWKIKDGKKSDENIVYRNGKPYRKVSGKDAKWL